MIRSKESLLEEMDVLFENYINNYGVDTVLCIKLAKYLPQLVVNTYLNKTNIDNIVSHLTDDDIVNFIYGYSDNRCDHCALSPSDSCNLECKKGIKEWLKRNVLSDQ